MIKINVRVKEKYLIYRLYKVVKVAKVKKIYKFKVCLYPVYLLVRKIINS